LAWQSEGGSRIKRGSSTTHEDDTTERNDARITPRIKHNWQAEHEIRVDVRRRLGMQEEKACRIEQRSKADRAQPLRQE